jgi:periplasmic protein TonB
MALHVALSDYAPKRGLQAGPPLAGSLAAGDRPNRNHVAISLLLHLLVLFGIFLLPQTPPLEVVVPVVTLRLEESGAAGAAGGKAGGGGGGGHGAEASSAPTEQKTTPQKNAEAASEPSEATPEPPTPPDPTPPTPTPPTPAPPTPEASPLPPAPQALAPKPKPHPVVKRQTAKPAPPVPVKSVETPPPPPPTVATEPPPGPGNGQGPPTQNPQPGTAATGTANAGPGGATGIGTGAAGAGRGAFGNGKGTGDDYLDRLRRHLLKYKRTPPDAIARRQEGTVYVSIEIARDGTVLAATIQRSSGFPLLDQAILDMVRSASPVPPLPPEVPGAARKVGLDFKFTIGVLDRIFN